jgi:hypothetical protein
VTPLALLLLAAAAVLIYAGVRGESLVADLSSILRGGK